MPWARSLAHAAMIAIVLAGGVEPGSRGPLGHARERQRDGHPDRRHTRRPDGAHVARRTAAQPALGRRGPRRPCRGRHRRRVRDHRLRQRVQGDVQHPGPRELLRGSDRDRDRLGAARPPLLREPDPLRRLQALQADGERGPEPPRRRVPGSRGGRGEPRDVAEPSAAARLHRRADRGGRPELGRARRLQGGEPEHDARLPPAPGRRAERGGGRAPGRGRRSGHGDLRPDPPRRGAVRRRPVDRRARDHAGRGGALGHAVHPLRRAAHGRRRDRRRQADGSGRARSPPSRSRACR